MFMCTHERTVHVYTCTMYMYIKAYGSCMIDYGAVLQEGRPSSINEGVLCVPQETAIIQLISSGKRARQSYIELMGHLLFLSHAHRAADLSFTSAWGPQVVVYMVTSNITMQHKCSHHGQLHVLPCNTWHAPRPHICWSRAFRQI